MKKFLSIILTVVMLLAAVPTVAFAVDYIDKVDVDFVVPVVGNKAVTESIVEENAAYKIKEAKWIDAASNTALTEEDVFAEGEYIIEATFEADEDYKFKKAESVEVIINGVEADKVNKNLDGTLTATLSFTCKDSGINIPSFGTLISNLKIVLVAFLKFIGSLLGLK